MGNRFALELLLKHFKVLETTNKEHQMSHKGYHVSFLRPS